MRQIPELFTQQNENNAHVQTRSISEVQSSAKGDNMTNDQASAPVSEKELEINQITNEALTLAAPFIPGGPIAAKIAQFSGLAPEVVHLGFVFAHLFSHHKAAPIVAASVSAPIPAPVPVAPSPEEVAAKQKADAIALITKQMADLQAQLAKLQS